MAPQTLSMEEARRVALLAQGLRGPRAGTGGGVPGMLRRLGAVQLDTISVLARSHELVAYARQGAIGRARVERAYWGPKSSTFEYWSHAACVLPLEDWPAYGFKRRARRAKGKRWHVLQERDKTCGEVVARLRADGPLTANELGGAKKGGPWWDWSETKIAAEWLLDIGDVVCRERRGFQRVYDLAERAVPADLLGSEWTDEECAVHLVAAAGRSLGVATEADLAVYHGLPRPLVRRALPSTDLVEVTVEGWTPRGYADPAALDLLGARARGRDVLLSPFDSLIWYRERVERLFGLRHRLEAYVPKHKRGLRLLRHARALGHHRRRAGRSGPPGRRPRGQAGDAAASERDGRGGAGNGRGRLLGRLRGDRRRTRGPAGGAAGIGRSGGRAPGVPLALASDLRRTPSAR